MVVFELRKEIKKDVFRLATSMDFNSSLSSLLLIECGYIM